MGRRRLWVLLAVHALIAVHLIWWWTQRRALTPLEPSESIDFVQRGVVNAGLVLFLGAGLLTLVFGRFFCGWACHLVALQDACRWLLVRLGFRPAPLRSRLLKLVPLAAFFYMFLLPYAARLVRGPPHPGVTDTEWTTAAFWESFPGPGIAILTFLVCGFAMVWFLGSKGFCTYACPYGALFGAADAFAPGRIRVSEACQGCGHCTAVCTSNVRVHQEVREFGAVVDPGCMKCMDCVSACPNDALRFGFGAPAAFTSRRAPAAPRPASLGWGEDLLLLTAGLGAYFTTHDLYGRIPFLLAVGFGCLSGFFVWKAWRTLQDPQARLAQWVMKSGGRLTPAGRTFLAATAVLVLVLGHAGWVRARALERNSAFEELRPWMEAVLVGGAIPDEAPAPFHAVGQRLEQAVGAAQAIGWMADARNPFALAWARLAQGDPAGFEAGMAGMLDLRPGFGEALMQRGLVRFRRGDLAGARADFEAIAWHDRRRPEAESFLADLNRLGG